MTKIFKNRLSFTMTELLVALISLSIIIGIAIPNFRRAAIRSAVRDISLQLKTMHAVIMIKSVTDPAVLETGGANRDVDWINTNFEIQLIESGQVTYWYEGGEAGGTEYRGWANYTDGSVSFKVEVYPTLYIGNTNPCCATSSADPCRGLPDCCDAYPPNGCP